MWRLYHTRLRLESHHGPRSFNLSIDAAHLIACANTALDALRPRHGH